MVEFEDGLVEVEGDSWFKAVDRHFSVPLPRCPRWWSLRCRNGVGFDALSPLVIFCYYQFAVGFSIGEPDTVVWYEPVWVVGYVEVSEGWQG